MKNASAMNWAHLAQQFGWQVSTQPTVGSIIVLQPGIQGAYSEGHVGVVERVLNNGSVTVSSMNWGSNPTAVTQHQFHPGPGVAFVRQPS
jgi:surface antigen